MGKKGLIIAIDGPSAVGKSTIARLIAHELGYLYVETGAIYRAITWKVLKDKIDLNNEVIIIDLVSRINISMKSANNQSEENFRIFIDGEEVTKEIRSPEIDKYVSQIARIPKIRGKLVSIQRNLAKNGKVVMEGRDIGSKILPHADIKFFFTASEEARIQRRFRELIEKGYQVNYEEVKEQIIKRDFIDSQRKYAPLVKTKDAIVIDSTHKSIIEVKEEIMGIIDRIKKGRKVEN